MKMTAIILGLVLTGFAVSAVVAHGPEDGRQGGRDCPWSSDRCDKKDRPKHGPKAEFGEHGRHLARLLDLDLSDQQRDDMRSLFKANMKQMADVIWPMAEAHWKLDKLRDELPADDRAIRDAADQLGDAVADAVFLKAQFKRSVHEILTPEQTQKLGELDHNDRHSRFSPKGGRCDRHGPDRPRHEAEPPNHPE